MTDPQKNVAARVKGVEYLYHSFPRRKDGETDDQRDARSLKILEKILEKGLLLTPEIIPPDYARNWRGSLMDGRAYPAQEIRQNRLCLTALDLGELRQHAEEFGPISIQLTKESVLKMGGRPVIYVPPYRADLDSANHLGNLNSEIMLAVQASMELMRRIQNDNTITEKHISDLPPISDLHKYLSYMAGYFCLTDSGDGKWDNYHQKEWRVIGPVDGSRNPFRRATPEEQKELIERESFFAGKIKCTDPDSGKVVQIQRAEYCHYLDRLEEKPIHDFFEALVVPPKLVPEAERIVIAAGCEIPVKPYS